MSAEEQVPNKSHPVPQPNVKNSLAGQAYGHLRRAIVRGDLKAGRAVSYADVCEILRMSRTPVREALTRLELEGYLARDAADRLIVFMPTYAQVIEDFVVREILEVHAVELAATRVSDAELAQMDELLAADRAALVTESVDALAWTNNEIHDLVLGASRNRALIGLVQRLRAKVQGIHAFAVGSAEQQSSFVQQHARIGAALRDGDAQTAMELTRAHLRAARDVLLDELDEDFPPVVRQSEVRAVPARTHVPAELIGSLGEYDGRLGLRRRQNVKTGAARPTQ